MIAAIIGLVLALFYSYKKLQELDRLLREVKSKQIVVEFSNCQRVKVLRVIEKRRYPELPRTVGYALDLKTARMYGNAYVDHELWHVPTTGLFFTDEMRRVEPLTPPVAASAPHTHL